jgi:serine/threonine protein phosphatase PrpC
VLIDGEIKIFGIFDGHGVYGHLVSGFAAGTMLDYIRNHEHTFNKKRLLSNNPKD